MGEAPGMVLPRSSAAGGALDPPFDVVLRRQRVRRARAWHLGCRCGHRCGLPAVLAPLRQSRRRDVGGLALLLDAADRGRGDHRHARHAPSVLLVDRALCARPNLPRQRRTLVAGCRHRDGPRPAVKVHGAVAWSRDSLRHAHVPRMRVWWRRPEPYLAGILAFAIFLPVVVWNYQPRLGIVR